MQCLSCASDNPASMKFCGACGATLQHHCFQCGCENPPRFKFYGQCGSSLAQQTPGYTQEPLQGCQRDASCSIDR